MRSVYLLDASSGLERRLLREWMEKNAPAQREEVPLPFTRGKRTERRTDRRLSRALEAADTMLCPLRVLWLPPERDGSRGIVFRDLLTLANPRAPSRLRQEWIVRRHPERCRVIAAEPATVAALKERWAKQGGSATDADGFSEFVARTGALALERAERQTTGARYKVPRFVQEEILARPEFAKGLAQVAGEMPPEKARRKAAKYLAEIAARHSPYVIDLVHRAIRLAYTQGYSEAVHYDDAKLQAIFALARKHPVVFLPTHKSNLDHAMMQWLLHENGMPPSHAAGGINMNFFPVGPLFRRTGVFFIRRSFKDNPLYKYVLRQYVDFLVEKRFSMEWYIEGGRSRSGKLLPPRFGLLSYVVDAWKRGKSEDVFLVPVSIAYDQISDVGDYAAEQRGEKKQKESLGWFVKMLRGLRRRYGDIHIRFGEPLSVAKTLGGKDAGFEPGGDEEGAKNVAVAKLAFEVCNRINRVTPVTPTSLVCLALLEEG
ncbi:MAG TPA: 1-acyl-sn-glycerol-3-phosphate acyltransferase, partial [bacterium]|nr:1-acyl-sn-glycerol-3-phosphate acyltransferase [bacterium]